MTLLFRKLRKSFLEYLRFSIKNAVLFFVVFASTSNSVVYLLQFLDWRKLALVGAIIPIISVLLTLRAPETPRFLLNTSQRSLALRSLLWLRGTSASAEEECRDMEENADAGERTGWSEFRRPELYRPLFVSCTVMIFQQLCGINVVIFYTVSIFQSAGFDKETSGLATVAIGAVQVFGTVIACFLMDRSGRRKLLIIGGLSMGLTAFMMGVYYQQMIHANAPTDGSTARPVENNLGWLAIFSLVGYSFAFAVGWGPIPMLLMSEIFPAKVRGAASAVASLVNWTLAFIVTNQFANLTAVLGSHGTFWLFGTFCVLSVGFVFRFVPETKGKSLDDIELYFLGRAIRGV